MVAGRPREHDRKEIADKMIAWSLEDDSLNLCGFCSVSGLSANQVLNWTATDEEFRVAYEQVRTRLGYRREKKLSEGKLHVKAYDLNATVYDRFLKNERRDDATFDAKLKAASDLNASEQQRSNHQAIIDAIVASQSDRSIADKSNKADAISD